MPVNLHQGNPPQALDSAMNYGLMVNNAPLNLYGRLIVLNFDLQVKLAMRMETPFRAKLLVVGSITEYAIFLIQLL